MSDTASLSTDASTLTAAMMAPMSQLEKDANTAKKGIKDAEAVEEKGVAKENKALGDQATLIGKQTEERQKYDATHPFPHPDLKPWTEKPPTNDPMKQFGSWASAFGILAGAVTKTGLASSLNASAAAINAFRKNDLEAYEDAKKSWKENSEIAIQQADWEAKAYDHGWNLMEKDQAAGLSQLTIAATQAKNEQMLGALKKGDFKTAFDISKGLADMALQGPERMLRMQELATKMEDTRERAKLLTEALAKDSKLPPEQQMTPERKAQLRTQIMNPQYTINQAKTLAEGLGASTGLTPSAIAYWGKRVRGGEAMPPLGIGKQASLDRRAIAQWAADDALANGDSAAVDMVKKATLASEKQSLTQLVKQQNAIHQFEQTAVANGRVLMGLVDKVDSTGVPVLERWIRGGRKSIAGDEDVTKFDAQLQVYLPEVAKILSNPNMTGVLSDSARDEAKTIVDRNFTAEQIKAVVPLLEQDFGRRDAAISDEVKIVQDTIGQLADKNYGRSPSDVKEHPPVPTGVPDTAQWSASTKEFWWQENGEWKHKAAQ